MKELLFGAAYYDEYMPYDRLDQDVALMKNSGHQHRADRGVHLEYLRAAGGRF